MEKQGKYNDEIYVDKDKSPNKSEKSNFRTEKSTIGLIAVAVVLAVVIAIILNQ